MCGHCGFCISLKVAGLLFLICMILYIIRRVDFKLHPWEKFKIMNHTNGNNKTYYTLIWVRKKFGRFNETYEDPFHWNMLNDAKWYRDHATRPSYKDVDEWDSTWVFNLDNHRIRISDDSSFKNRTQKWDLLQHKLNEKTWTTKYED